MLESFKHIASESIKFFKSQSPARIVGMTLTGVGILVAIVMMFVWIGEKTYVPLMTNLNPEDATNIIRVLRDKRIPFQVDPTGRNITVPPESLYEFRLELATMGLPQSGVVGYEVFDKQSLGTTSFVQKMNQKRALEGELTRTIDSIRGVRRSRVHLALPQKSTFVEDQKKSTASVVIDLEPGVQLSDKQVFGIGNLVARGVEGMDVADVVVLDSNGKILSKNASDPLTAATATQLEFQHKKEEELEKSIESILGRVVGDGHVVAKVNAELDFSQVSETQTLVDADGSAVLSVDKQNDHLSGSRPGPQGLSGAASNQPGQPPATSADIRNETTKDNERINYQVPQTVRHTTHPLGSVKRLTVAVVVDGMPVTRSPASSGTGDAKAPAANKGEPWSPEKIKEFEEIVAGVVGLDKTRGDTLEIKNMEFTHEDFEEASRLLAEKDQRSYVQNLVMYGVIGVIIALFFLMVVRPFIKWITENSVDSVDTFLPQTIEELERLSKTSALPGLEDAIPQADDKLDPEKVQGEMMREKITSLVDTNPHKAALILKDWLHPAARAGGGGEEGEEESPATA